MFSKEKVPALSGLEDEALENKDSFFATCEICWYDNPHLSSWELQYEVYLRFINKFYKQQGTIMLVYAKVKAISACTVRAESTTTYHACFKYRGRINFVQMLEINYPCALLQMLGCSFVSFMGGTTKSFDLHTKHNCLGAKMCSDLLVLGKVLKYTYHHSTSNVQPLAVGKEDLAEMDCEAQLD